MNLTETNIHTEDLGSRKIPWSDAMEDHTLFNILASACFLEFRFWLSSHEHA